MAPGGGRGALVADLARSPLQTQASAVTCRGKPRAGVMGALNSSLEESSLLSEGGT